MLSRSAIRTAARSAVAANAARALNRVVSTLKRVWMSCCLPAFKGDGRDGFSDRIHSQLSQLEF
jgi:hypothetical protein